MLVESEGTKLFSAENIQINSNPVISYFCKMIPDILKQIIQSRKSIFPRDYTAEEIPQEILEEILNSAHFAPNHKRTKPWRFKIFRGLQKNELGKNSRKLTAQLRVRKFSSRKNMWIFLKKLKKQMLLLPFASTFQGSFRNGKKLRPLRWVSKICI